jgi:hypothetical protein
MAIRGVAAVESLPYPESTRTRHQEAEVFQSMKRDGLGLAALAVGGALLWEFSKKGNKSLDAHAK